MARLHLIRHGETDWNVQKRYQGSQDIPLNERGRLQAEEARKSLSDKTFAGIYSSDLKRAMETAEIIRGEREHLIETFSELQETCYGSLEGKTFAEIEAQFGMRLDFQTQLSNLEKLHHKIIPDMESGFEVINRVLPTLELIARKHKDQDVIVVTHGGVIRALLVHLADYDWSTTKIQNGQVVTFIYKENRFEF